jgi:hypothetical protein
MIQVLQVPAARTIRAYANGSLTDAAVLHIWALLVGASRTFRPAYPRFARITIQMSNFGKLTEQERIKAINDAQELVTHSLNRSLYHAQKLKQYNDSISFQTKHVNHILSMRPDSGNDSSESDS